MAKAKMPLPPMEALRDLIDREGRLAVRVTPGARGEALEIVGGRLMAKVRAKPEDGKANEAVRILLAAALGLAASRVELLGGVTSRQKQFHVKLPTRAGEGDHAQHGGEASASSPEGW
ncbi:hypothetical protein L284_15165 [Novosphingobium lindaniclasticum LE124]|uniref:UPF0235 protein L284_15165 n=1 Tax=Novosphingobium lindaniclasticum LE124 TaxID=1096930 RepID=T0HHT2_9SPHN|nr:DUF167 family protein [Novosphingobium lindaniclasticum]EQB12592.1 hypothetical protein L284_15165 [Novosphingobium lindaniclasticum LE124]